MVVVSEHVSGCVCGCGSLLGFPGTIMRASSSHRCDAWGHAWGHCSSGRLIEGRRCCRRSAPTCGEVSPSILLRRPPREGLAGVLLNLLGGPVPWAGCMPLAMHPHLPRRLHHTLVQQAGRTNTVPPLQVRHQADRRCLAGGHCRIRDTFILTVHVLTLRPPPPGAAQVERRPLARRSLSRIMRLPLPPVTHHVPPTGFTSARQLRVARPPAMRGTRHAVPSAASHHAPPSRRNAAPHWTSRAACPPALRRPARVTRCPAALPATSRAQPQRPDASRTPCMHARTTRKPLDCCAVSRLHREARVAP